MDVYERLDDHYRNKVDPPLKFSKVAMTDGGLHRIQLLEKWITF